MLWSHMWCALILIVLIYVDPVSALGNPQVTVRKHSNTHQENRATDNPKGSNVLQNHLAAQYHQPDSHTDSNQSTIEIARLTRYIAYANIALVIVYTFIYWNMRRSTYLTDRPYLMVELVRIDGWSNGAMLLTYQVHNYGKSPGWMIWQHLRAQVEPTTNRYLRAPGQPTRPDYGHLGDPFGGVVAPGQVITIQIRDDPGDPPSRQYLTLPSHQETDVRNGALFLFVHGFMEYRDIHRRWNLRPNVHQTCFCYRWNHNVPLNQPHFAVVENDAYWHYT